MRRPVPPTDRVRNCQRRLQGASATVRRKRKGKERGKGALSMHASGKRSESSCSKILLGVVTVIDWHLTD